MTENSSHLKLSFGIYEPLLNNSKKYSISRHIKWRNNKQWFQAHAVSLPMVRSAAEEKFPIRLFFIKEENNEIADTFVSFLLKMLPPGVGPAKHDSNLFKPVQICCIANGNYKSKLVLLDEICLYAEKEKVEVSVIWDESGELDDIAYLKHNEVKIDSTPGDITKTAYYFGSDDKLDANSIRKCKQNQQAAEWLFAVRYQYLMWCEFIANNNSHFPMSLDKKMSDYLSCGLVDFPEDMEDIDENDNRIAYVCDEYEILPEDEDVCFCLAKRDKEQWHKTCSIITYGAQMYACVEEWVKALHIKNAEEEFPSLMEMWLGKDLSSGKMLDITGLKSGYPNGYMQTGDNRMYDKIRFLGDKYQMKQRLEKIFSL